MLILFCTLGIATVTASEPRAVGPPSAVEVSTGQAQPKPGIPPVMNPVRAGSEPYTAGWLLERFRQQLNSEEESEDLRRVASEVEWLRAAKLPAVRLRQSSSWGFGSVTDLAVGGSMSAVLSDPEGDAEVELATQRLLLAQHNAGSERRSRTREFLRTLRLLAHLEEVEAVLDRHRRRLLVERPHWSELESTLLTSNVRPELLAAASVAGLEGGEIGYLEVVQALERTRRERSLRLQLIEARAGLAPRQLEGAVVGRPPPTTIGTAEESCLAGESPATEEADRARLLLQEARLAARVAGARRLPRVSLDLSGNARYQFPAVGGDSWRGDLGLSLRVVMPAGKRVSGHLQLDMSRTGLNQEVTVGLPGSSGPPEESAADAEARYRRSLGEARLAGPRATLRLLDARDRRQLRALELAQARSALDTRGQQTGLLDIEAQAELALLNSELEFDLALIDAAEICPAG